MSHSMSSLLCELPFFSLTTAEFCNINSDRFDNVFSNSALRDFISNVEIDTNQLTYFDYLTETEFNNKYASKLDNGSISLSVFHLNIRSLNSNHRKLCQFPQLLCIQFDIIVLTEIWSSNITFYCNVPPGYNFDYSLPTKGTVGGVGIFVSQTLESSEDSSCCLNSSEVMPVENIWLNIVKNNNKFLIGGIYRHPGCSLAEFSGEMENV